MKTFLKEALMVLALSLVTVFVAVAVAVGMVAYILYTAIAKGST